jgi:hypothetical protein
MVYHLSGFTSDAGKVGKADVVSGQRVGIIAYALTA